jgi:peptidoglycan/xylan/chitin deacetylase (PgdA/CDA1 family)
LGKSVSNMILCTIIIVCLCLFCRDVHANTEYESLFSYKGLIREGDNSHIVKILQEVLAKLGYHNYGCDGLFGKQTAHSVKSFQKDVGLVQDGIAGPDTLRELKQAYNKKFPPDKYVVQKGDNLEKIAYSFGFSVSYLAEINNIKNPDRIYQGQVISLVQKTDPKHEAEQEEILEITEPHKLYPPADKRICLTFDDGPDPITTRRILDVLNRYDVKATFFVIGRKVEKYPELLRDIVEAGHVVGAHGYEHKVLSGLRGHEVYQDIKKCYDSIVYAAGYTPYLYRPPFGYLDETQVTQALALGLQVVMWTNIGGGDLNANSPEEVVTRVINQAKDGGIIMLHEGLQPTLEALPLIIETLARTGFGFQNPSKPSR